MPKVTIDLDDDQAATVRALNGGEWTESPEFWAEVVAWGLGTLEAKHKAEAEAEGATVIWGDTRRNDGGPF